MPSGNDTQPEDLGSDDPPGFGGLPARLRDARHRAKLSQRQAASMLNTSQPYLCKLEGGHITPSVQAIVRIAKLYGASLDWLILGRAK